MKIAKLARAPRLVLGLAVFAVLVIALISGFLLTSAGDFAISDYQAGQSSVAAVENASEDVVIATVGGEEITLVQFTEGLHHLDYMKDISQRELDGLQETGLPTEYLQARQDLVILWGNDNVALAMLVEDSLLHQKAMDLGLSVSGDEIDENVALARRLFESGEIDAYNKGYAQAKGMERYWNEYPAKAERSLLRGKLHLYVASRDDSFSHADSTLAWHEFTEIALTGVEIRLSASEHHAASLESVLGHLASVREIDRSRIRQANGLPRAPEDQWVVHIKPEGGLLVTRRFGTEPVYCHKAATDSQGICDAQSGELLMELGSDDLYAIVRPGAILPVFPEEG